MKSRNFSFRLGRSLALAGALAVLLLEGADSSSLFSAPNPSDTNAVAGASTNKAPIPLAEVAAQAESASITLQAAEATASASQITATVEQDLPIITREMDARLELNFKILSRSPSLDHLRRLENEWRDLGQELAAWNRRLTKEATQLEAQLGYLSEMNQRWESTRVSGDQAKMPPEVLQRVETVLANLKQTRDKVEARHAEILVLQNRVTEQHARATQALNAIEQARTALIHQLLLKDEPPIWSSAIWSRPPLDILLASRRSFLWQLTALTAYAQRKVGRFVLHGILLLVFGTALSWAKRRLVAPQAEPAPARHVALVFQAPFATAFVITFLASGWIYPQAPGLLWAILGATGLIPTTIVLRRLLDPHLFPILNVLVGFYFIDRLRAVAASQEMMSRALLLLETVGGACFVGWLLRSQRLSAIPPANQDASWRIIRLGARIALACFTVAVLANCLGYERLSQFLTNAVLAAADGALILYAVVRILDSLLANAMDLRPLNSLEAVQKHRPLLRARARRMLGWIGIVLWFIYLLEAVALRGAVFHGINHLVKYQLHLGARHFSVGDILLFALSIWIALLTSRLVRFLLDEEVYPRVQLAAGLSYSISKAVHYVFLIAGLFVGAALLGFNLSKLTILAGAVGVGLGFGLQNIINNFVSGVILLFERPVKIGDLIQIGDTEGVVQSIGIRASVVRTNSGAEIIVPNGKLISDPLTNWTFSKRRRLLEIPVAAAPGPAPQRVIELLQKVTREHASVVQDPPPQVLFQGSSGGSLNFIVRAWTNRFEDWSQIRSDLALAINSTLATENINIR